MGLSSNALALPQYIVFGHLLTYQTLHAGESGDETYLSGTSRVPLTCQGQGV